MRFDDELMGFDHNSYPERIIGTRGSTAHVYDFKTYQLISTLTPERSNNYSNNQAVLNPTDDLIFSDGVLWDVRIERPVHLFDKTNITVNGVFHPQRTW